MARAADGEGAARGGPLMKQREDRVTDERGATSPAIRRLRYAAAEPEASRNAALRSLAKLQEADFPVLPTYVLPPPPESLQERVRGKLENKPGTAATKGELQAALEGLEPDRETRELLSNAWRDLRGELTSDYFLIRLLPPSSRLASRLRNYNSTVLSGDVQQFIASVMRLWVLAILAMRGSGAGGAHLRLAVQLLATPEARGRVISRALQDELWILFRRGASAEELEGEEPYDEIVRVCRKTWTTLEHFCNGPEREQGEAAYLVSMVKRVTGLAIQLETWAANPCDVLFCWSHESVSVIELQRRAFFPLSKRRRRRSAGKTGKWSSMLFAEGWPGPLTPLTASLLHRHGEPALRLALRSVGSSIGDDTALLRLRRQRLVVDWTSVAESLARLPMFSPDALTRHLGLSGEEAQVLRRACAGRGYVRRWLRAPWAAGRITHTHLRFESRVWGFSQTLDYELERLQEVDLRVLPAKALADISADLEGMFAAVLRLWALALVHTLLAAAFFDSLSEADEERAASDYLRVPTPTSELMRSVEATRRIAQAVGNDALSEQSALATLKKKGGYFSYDSLELSRPRWRDAPQAVRNLVHCLAQEPNGPIKMRSAASGLSSWALKPVHRGASALIGSTCGRYQDIVVQTSRLMSVIRDLALEASRRLMLSASAVGSDGAFYLSPSELRRALVEPPQDLSALITLRRDVHLRLVGHAQHRPPVGVAGQAEIRRLHGLGASPGVVKGRLKFVAYPSDMQRVEADDILCAQRWHVGWCEALLPYKAAVFERGGPWSTAAVVARTYGIPCITGLGDALGRVPQGALVEVDGSAGRLTLLATER